MSYVAITTTYYVILLTTLGLVACYGWYRCANDFQAMRARVAEFERNAGRNPPFVAEWHARAVALGYDGVSDMLNSVERGEPPIHVAEVLARAASTKDGA